VEDSTKKGSILEEEEPFVTSAARHRSYGVGLGCACSAGGAAGTSCSGMAGVVVAGGGAVVVGAGMNASSSTERGPLLRADIRDSANARKRKTPPPHQLALVRSVLAWRVPSRESVELLIPPKVAASPPPFPAWRRMAVTRIALSMKSRMSRNVYIGGR
jgi:hypothetical protein